MLVSDFDFELPESLIAKAPLPHRDGAKLLCVARNSLSDRLVTDLPSLVQPGDIWVVNDTKVIPARLIGQKQSGGKVEVLLLEPLGEDHVWAAWGKANKPIQVGTIVQFSETFTAEVLAREGKNIEVRLHSTHPLQDAGQAIEACGHMPLPPYINRPDSEADKQRYQTVFAAHKGAVAAPTAGLHFTPELMQAMTDTGATFVHVTLHVGPGTFQPVQVEDVATHIMHEEAYIISQEAADSINAAKANGQRIVAVGTTSLRTLEAAGQSGKLIAGTGRTDIFITPGYTFNIIDALFTNYHLPKSTLLMLASAAAGKEEMLAAYQHAIAHQYRFYSYGDAMFIPALKQANTNRV